MSKRVFLGRGQELKYLNKTYAEKHSHFTVLYGRRRIGKTELLTQYCHNKTAFYYSALEVSQSEQIKNFLNDFAKFCGDSLLAKIECRSWRDAFDIVAIKMPKKKTVIVFDEFQWMCGTGSALQSVIQHLWDQIWQHENRVHLVLCGSSTSFMVSEVLSEKSPLFGRRTQVTELKPLNAHDALAIMKTKNQYDAARYVMCFGAIPGYLKLYDPHTSFEQNLNKLAFSQNGYFIHELDYILSSQLKQPKRYFRILQHLAKQALSLTDLAKIIKTPTGSLIFNIEKLKAIGIIAEHHPLTLSDTSKTILYKISDEYVRFYFLFIHSQKQAIEKNQQKFIFDVVTKQHWHTHLGLAFELFCHKNMDMILKKLGIEDTFIKSGIYWHKTSVRNGLGVQIDLVIECRDQTTFLAECKWSENTLNYDVFFELEKKCERYPNPKRHKLKKLLLTNAKLTPQLIDHPELAVVSLSDFFMAY